MNIETRTIASDGCRLVYYMLDARGGSALHTFRRIWMEAQVHAAQLKLEENRNCVCV